MSGFQIVTLIWLILLSAAIVLLVLFARTCLKHYFALDERLKDLEQAQRGNPFVQEGIRAQKEKRRG